MRLEVAFEYPNSLDTERLVMFYDRLSNPRGDAATMDRHVARLEMLLGRPLRAKVYWVRGPLRRLGLSRLSTHALALGSQESPTDWSAGGGLDRHELAHAVLDELRTRGADPPKLLHEGWATAQSGEQPEILARNALAYRKADPARRLRDQVEPDRYYLDAGPVYAVGGAFVAFLIRRYGSELFFKLYNEGKPETFATDCRRIYGMNLAALEKSFWDEARILAGGSGE